MKICSCIGSGLESCFFLIHHVNLSPLLLPQIGSLQIKIIGEDKTMEQKTQDLLQEWEKEKPVQVTPRSFSLLLSVLGKKTPPSCTPSLSISH